MGSGSIPDGGTKIVLKLLFSDMLKLFKNIWNFIKNLFKRKTKEVIVFVPNNNFDSWTDVEKEIAAMINTIRNEQSLLRKATNLLRITSSKDLIPEKICRREAIYRTFYQTSLESGISHNNMGSSAIKLESEGLSKYGEILGYGYTSAEAVVNAWYKSLSHRNMILSSKYKYFGVAHIYSEAKKRHYYCVVFSNE